VDIEKDREYGRNAAVVLAAWADYVARGGLARPPADAPGELLDLEDRVTAEVVALIGVAIAIHVAGRPEAARTVLSLCAKTSAQTESTAPVARTVPLAAGLAKWAGADRGMVLRGMGCLTAMTLQRAGSAEPPPGLAVEDMVRDGAVWTMTFPGAGGTPAPMETLGTAMATYVFPEGEEWVDLVGAPDPHVFTGWAAYLYAGGLDRPIDSVHFSLLGGMGVGGKLVDAVTASVISAAICLAAHDRGPESTELLAKMEQIVRRADGDVEALSVMTASEIGPLQELASACGRDAAAGSEGCFTALALWQAGMLRCLDPHHTLRKMALSRTTRFATDRSEYTIDEFSRLQGEILRGLQRGGGERDGG